MKRVVVFMGAGLVADSYTAAEREANIWLAKHPDAIILASHTNMAATEKWSEYAITLIVDTVDIETSPRPTVVCLCGSTRFSEAFHEANLRETLAGNIVLSIGCDFKSDADLLIAGVLTPEDKARLDELHLRKIDLADEILVLNVGKYIGESTIREVYYARAHGKRVRWLEVPDGQPE